MRRWPRWTRWSRLLPSNAVADSLDSISSATGIDREVMLALWAEVKANHAKLEACPRHDFIAMEPDPRRLSGKWRCASCGGEVEASAARWYRLGLEHAGAGNG